MEIMYLGYPGGISLLVTESNNISDIQREVIYRSSDCLPSDAKLI